MGVEATVGRQKGGAWVKRKEACNKGILVEKEARILQSGCIAPESVIIRSSELISSTVFLITSRKL